MSHHSRFISSLAVLLTTWMIAAAAVAAPPPMNAGKWQITMQTLTPVQTDPMVTTVCISPDNALKPSAPQTSPDADCQVASPGLTAQNTLDYTVTCAKKNSGTSAHFAYTGDRFEGTVTITPADGHPIVQKITGIRIDTCPVPVSVPAPK
jgi:hypothetical protein